MPERAEPRQQAAATTEAAGASEADAARTNSPAGETLKKLTGPLGLEQMRRVVADPAVMRGHNLLCALFVPAENRMLLSCGRIRAAQGKFTEYKLFAR